MLVVLTVFVVLFEVWFAIAYLYAFRQVGERVLLLPVIQALTLALLFTYIAFIALNKQPMSALVSFPLLFVAMVALLLWRRRGGIRSLVRQYPRGMVDVLLFRRPAVDLKRRVRTK
ncbi:MAG: hypothetical protein MI924_39425 [Chloroflexales bacterium]|nr:hypothetical protein [Chloroflexales bacterium]